MSCAISQLVYMPNFRAIGQSVWEKNGNTHTHTDRQKHTQTDLNFINIDVLMRKLYYTCFCQRAYEQREVPLALNNKTIFYSVQFQYHYK